MQRFITLVQTQLPSDSGRFWRWETECTDVKNFIFIEALGQHKAVLREQPSMKIVHRLKEYAKG